VQDKNQDTLNEIVLKVRKSLESFFIESFSKSHPQFESLQGIQELTSWYKKTEKEDHVLDKILEKIISEIMKYLPRTTQIFV